MCWQRKENVSLDNKPVLSVAVACRYESLCIGSSKSRRSDAFQRALGACIFINSPCRSLSKVQRVPCKLFERSSASLHYPRPGFFFAAKRVRDVVLERSRSESIGRGCAQVRG